MCNLCIALCAHHLKSNLLSPCIWPHLHPHPHSLGNHHIVVCVYEFQFYIIHTSEVIGFLVFSDWLISLSIIFSGPSLLSKMAVFHLLYGWVVFMYHIFFIQSCAEECFSCLYLLATVNSAAMNIEVHIPLQMFSIWGNDTQKSGFQVIWWPYS